MTPQAFRALGEAIYGRHWQHQVADALQVTDRTVRRWASGAREIPATVKHELDAIAACRIDGIRRAMVA